MYDNTKHITLTEDEFYEKFNMVKNHLDNNASFDGCAFETFGEELQYIQKFAGENPYRIWTVLDCDGKLYYSTGYHFVNRLNYIITEEEFDCQIDVQLEDVGDDDEPTSGNYQCGSCEKFFDEPIDGECPHCKSGNWVKGCIDDPEPEKE